MASKKLSEMTVEELQARYKGIRAVAIGLLSIFGVLIAIMLGMYFTGNWNSSIAVIISPAVTATAVGTIFYSQMAAIKKELDGRANSPE